jgi:uncharacterized protein (DUF885 family)
VAATARPAASAQASGGAPQTSCAAPGQALSYTIGHTKWLAVRDIVKAKQGAAAFSEQKAQEAISQAQQILAKAESAAKADRDRLSSELKREFGRLVATTTAQVTGKVLSNDDQKRINDEPLAKIEG